MLTLIAVGIWAAQLRGSAFGCCRLRL
ncbi:MAG: hypothetical protein WCL60_14020 [Methylococcales bacterium]